MVCWRGQVVGVWKKEEQVAQKGAPPVVVVVAVVVVAMIVVFCVCMCVFRYVCSVAEMSCSSAVEVGLAALLYASRQRWRAC